MSERGIICLMPQQDARIAPAIGYTIERVRVYWDVEHGDVYSMHSKQIDGQWVKMYKPTKQGLNKLLMAGGIETVDQSTSQRGDLWIWDSKWKGRYTTPAGITIELEDEYTFDVTIGGPRWIKRREDEIDKLVKKEANLPWNAKDDVIIVARTKVSPERMSEISSIAESVATNFAVEAAQFGTQRAAAGARNRALRTYFEIREFTEKEIRDSYFEIYRTRVDHEAMREVLGDTGAKLLSFAQLLGNSGISDPKQIESLSRVLIEAEADMNRMKNAQLQKDDIDEDPYDVPLKKVTLNGIRGKVVRLAPSLAPLSDWVLAPALGKFLGREYTDETKLREVMNEGEGLSILKFYSLLSEEGTDNKDDWKRSCIRYIEERVVWDGTILPAQEPELIDPAE